MNGAGQDSWLWYAALVAAYPLFKLFDIIAHWVVGIFGWHSQKQDAREAKSESALSTLRQHVDGVHSSTANHFGLLEGRISDNYHEFLRFKTHIAEELASKKELERVEERIKDHVGSQVKLILERLPRSNQ